MIALPLLICGCQSSSTQRIQPVAAQCQPVPKPSAWFMEARARLDPAHAQRIIAITDDGNQGLIVLRACQAYVSELLTPR